ncbi:MAG TPA: NAD-dependent epimerase/dehydratase family protein [Candidatus Saccharimonadales bacterium]|nr:NAD-dependent epimerase/dehydratase family protein [Candidatus Saccharimonadales bacterium]
MATALIGYTGFVGSNLAAQHHFDDLYNSKNIADIEGKEYDLVVSAANRADMWRINQEGAADLAEINEFIGHIKKVQAKKFVLISTVGVYKSPNGADEDTPIDTDGLLPYGQNRYHLEEFVRGNFPEALIVRLPGLFGPGLKKNVIFDLLHNNMVDKIHSEGMYQYYNLANIWQDIQTALDNELPLVNLAAEPVRTADIAAYCFGLADFHQEPEGVKPAFWDMHSKHATLYGGSGTYLYTKQQGLDDIKAFVSAEKAKA